MSNDVYKKTDDFRSHQRQLLNFLLNDPPIKISGRVTGCLKWKWNSMIISSKSTLCTSNILDSCPSLMSKMLSFSRFNRKGVILKKMYMYQN